ncbi:MAG: DUF192 domain-containing protein [Treponemataceae bacterium]|nr:DUF192 domain-containing protein [Spirochaetales bacterium]MDY6030703.1 DUF192 domain-containing protein [Treponemataceae bacterium]
MKKSALLILILLMFFVLSSCSASHLEKQKLTIQTLDGREVTVVAEMARTEKEQMKGFMERKKIPDGTGMLFLFPKDKIARFWMKNTPAALSIAYIDHNGVIRDIFDMTPYSLSEVVSSCYVRYALEVPQGWFLKAGVQKGDVLILNF